MSASRKKTARKKTAPRATAERKSAAKGPGQQATGDSEVPTGSNVVVIQGEVSTEPLFRELPSGDVLVAFDIRVRRQSGENAQSIPVTWIGSAPERLGVLMGKQCLVLGAMHRRFYQSRTAGLQSRVDVRAEKVVTAGPARRRAAIARFLKARLPEGQQ